jgi:Prokaryotic E2 family E/Multiubiquitin
MEVELSEKDLEAEQLLAKAEELVEEAEALVDEIIDLEQHAKEGRRPPRARGYRIKVNDDYFVWHEPTIKGRQVLELAGLIPPDGYRLRLKITGGKPQPVGLDEVVDLRRHGLEKFRAIKNGQGEGETQGRRDAPTLDHDRVFLDTYGLHWEIIQDGSIWILIHNFPLPLGYNASHVLLAIRLEGGYPLSALDMFYVFPHVGRLDGRPIGQANVVQRIDGRDFQRWSRHRTPDNPWVAGQDSLETHIYLIEEALEAELTK